MAKKSLSPRRERYVRGRAAGKTQAKAATDAGYSPRRADVTGAELERDPEIRQAISDLVEEVMPLREVLDRIADRARCRIEDVATIVHPTPEPAAKGKGKGKRKGKRDRPWVVIDVAKAIREGKGHLITELGFTEFGPRVKLVSAEEADDTFLKLHGVVKERHEHTGKNGEPIKGEVHMYIPDNGRAAS